MCHYFTTNLRLTIYEGTSALAKDLIEDCSTIRCIAGHDNPFDHHSQVTFSTKPGVSYYILVHGVDGQRGSFQLDLQEAAENDLCETAIPVLEREPTASFNTTLPGVVARFIGSTALATFSGLSQAGDSCDGVFPTGPGIWYSVIGTGKVMRASTCVSSDELAALESLVDTTLIVLGGSNCRNLQCFGGNDDNTCGQHSLVEWQSIQDEQYYALVSGKLNERGSFELSIESLTA
jgi:hypothetical protein